MQQIIAGFQVDLLRKKIKGLHLYVCAPDGHIRVSAPLRMSVKDIESFIVSRADWIRAQQVKYAGAPMTAAALEDGDTILLWGRPCVLTIREAKVRSSVRLEGDRLILSVPKDAALPQKEAVLNAFYRRQLTDAIARLMPQWERTTGLKCSAWQIRAMTSRWGSCRPDTRKITLNLHLAKHPPECLSYVILHELMHIRIPNHGAEFKAMMTRFMPQWPQIKALLNGKVPQD
ncbi:MAG: SprT family zinc-dependent metalloprotease [Clostridia bacterium]|nr:SprT family zinc-dependent metalloprotease [Clostridia bacterium]